jgi:hypothetical protein
MSDTTNISKPIDINTHAEPSERQKAVRRLVDIENAISMLPQNERNEIAKCRLEIGRMMKRLNSSATLAVIAVALEIAVDRANS